MASSLVIDSVKFLFDMVIDLTDSSNNLLHLSHLFLKHTSESGDMFLTLIAMDSGCSKW